MVLTVLPVLRFARHCLFGGNRVAAKHDRGGRPLVTATRGARPRLEKLVSCNPRANGGSAYDPQDEGVGTAAGGGAWRRANDRSGACPGWGDPHRRNAAHGGRERAQICSARQR